MNVSPSVSTGISIGKPPACQTPRLTSSARSLKWVWQGVGVAPGVENGDDRLARHVLGAEAGLLGARAVAERAEVLPPEPAMAAQLRGGLTRHRGSAAPRRPVSPRRPVRWSAAIRTEGSGP